MIKKNISEPVKLVLLHAFPLDSRMWDEQRHAFPYQVITPDMFTTGDTIEEWAKRMLKTVDEGFLIIVGCSMGGFCALEVARLSPDRVLALVLVGSKAGHDPNPKLRDYTIAQLQRDGIGALWEHISSDIIGSQAPPTVVERVRSLMLDQPNDNLLRAVRAFHSRRDLSEFAIRWDKPLLFMCGYKDRVVTVKKTRKFVKRTSNGRMYVMQNCGHYMNMEQPSKFNKVIANFVESVVKSNA